MFIVDLLTKKLESSLDFFIETLKDSGQEHTTVVLQAGGQESTSCSAKLLKGLVAHGNKIIVWSL